MKNSYDYTMLQSDFWDYLVNKSKVLLDDMDNFQYSEEKFIEKIRNVDQQFLSFVWGMKFVAYEEEIIDENKKSDAIEETLGLDIIDQFVKNKTTIFKNLNPTTTLIITGPENVLKDEAHDSRWVLGVIKKCIAHGNFSLDFNRGVYIINNDDPVNELYCEAGCFWLAQLGNLITTDRNMTVNHTDLLLKPFICSYLERPMKNQDEVRRYLKSDDFLCYFPLISVDGTYEEKLKAKTELLEFWQKITIDSEFNGSSVILNAMPNMLKTVDNGQIRLVSLGEEHISRIISEVENVRNFYEMNPQSQQGIIETIMYDIGCIELFPSQSHNIDFGLDLLGNQISLSKFHGYLEECVSRNQEMHPSAPRMFADYTYKYGAYKKKMALAYFLGILLFSGNKDEIFDEEIDYEEFDLSNIVAYDFAAGKEIEGIITNIKNNISIIKEQQNTKKSQKVLDKKTEKLKSFEEQLLKNTDGIPATRPSNKEIFHRIRNAFSHKQIYNAYSVDDETNITTSIDMNQIILADEDKFVAYVNIDDLLALLMNKKFYDALKKAENKKQMNK